MNILRIISYPLEQFIAAFHSMGATGSIQGMIGAFVLLCIAFATFYFMAKYLITLVETDNKEEKEDDNEPVTELGSEGDHSVNS